jgi:PAS domain S-box-containing protein
MSGENPTFTNDKEHLQLVAALRESEILRELAELLASSLDLNHILQVLVKRTTEVCGIERCAVWLLEEDLNVLRPAAYHLSSQHLSSKTIRAADHIWYHTPLSLDDPVVHHLLEVKGTYTIEDLETLSGMHAVAEMFLVRSMLFVSLVREDRVVGMMTLDDPDRLRTFSIEQQQLARAIGQQAAIAIDNARLYQQAQMERKRAEQLIERAQAVNQVALAVNAGEDLAAVLEIAINHLVRGLKAESGAIVLLNKDPTDATGSCILYLASDTRPQQDMQARDAKGSSEGAFTTLYPTEQAIGRLVDLPHCYRVAVTGTPLFVNVEQVADDEACWYRELGLSSAIIVPLMVGTSRETLREGIGAGQAAVQTNPENDTSRCVGLAFVNYCNPNYRPSRGQIAFALDIAAQCALAVDKAHILADARQAATLATERANTLDAVFHAMTEGISVLNMDGHVVLRNHAASYFSAEHDYREDWLTEILKRHPAYTLHGQPVSVEDFPITRALRGERIRGERLVVRRSNGAESFIETNVAPLFDATGTQTGIVSAFRDITEQMRVEQRIRHVLETMLHLAVAVSGVTDITDILRSVLEMTLTTFDCDRGSVHMYDEERHIFMPLLACGFTEEAEKQWLTGEDQWFTPSALHSQREEQVQHARMEEQLLDGHATVIDTERHPELLKLYDHTTLLTVPITNAKRLLGLMMLDCSPAFKYSGVALTQVDLLQQQREFTIWDMAVIEGIAQLAGLAIEQARWQQEAMNARMSEAAMREANTLKDEFLAITAHEFRTPLTIILAHSQYALRALRRKTNQLTETLPQQSQGMNEVVQHVVEILSTIEEQAHQMTNIVNSFLEVTQINRGQLVLKLEEVDLSEIAKQVVANHSKTSADHHISCIIEPQACSYLVTGDSARLLQVISNLVQNAIKYSPDGGPIAVRLCRYMNVAGQSTIEIRVEDRGIGIPKDAQLHLFERFYRASNTQGNKGIGLGLYLVAELLRMHNGAIRVESSGIPGEGSRFICTLPALDQQALAGNAVL